MINSLITDTITHTKVLQTPDSLKILPINGTKLSYNIWGGITYPILIQLQGMDTPIKYGDMTTPILASTDFINTKLSNITQLSANNWGESDDPCGVSPLTCYSADLTIEYNEFEDITKIDECGNISIYKFPKTKQGNIVFTTQVNDTTLSGSYEDIHLSTFHDPFKIQMENENINYLDMFKNFDLDTMNGCSLLTGENTKISDIIHTIFGDEFTNNLNHKVLSFGKNLKNVDYSDTLALDQQGEKFGIKSSGFSDLIPSEITNILKIASIKYEDIFGISDESLKFSDNLVGDQIQPNETIKVDESVFIKPITDLSSEYQNFIIPVNSTDLLLTENLSGDESFPLSGIQNSVYNSENYYFWRSLQPTTQTINNFIDLTSLPFIPTKSEWNDIIKRKIDYELVKNLLS